MKLYKNMPNFVGIVIETRCYHMNMIRLVFHVIIQYFNNIINNKWN